MHIYFIGSNRHVTFTIGGARPLIS